ncbi:MAG: ribonuclease [Bacillus thermozeamaize]|uniref:4-hydroxy-4-methyl-2-oxoglutarate aldolase n=1 Tax=Bacillus thermozeamaize TaxID=230954 RepID=A0A1Y3PJB0_9BACI|nr:MAG: ribonuclease [Bacillus thermozeamaize]
MSWKTADLCDAFGQEVQVCQPLFRSFGGNQRFCGPVATVRVYEDNVLVKQAIESVPAGSVLVVDGGGSTSCALLGDNLAAIAVSRGLAGFIIHGCVRDTAELAKMQVGIYALASNPRKSNKQGKGQRDITLWFAGAEWTPGAWVYADEDGILVAPRALHT